MNTTQPAQRLNSLKWNAAIEPTYERKKTAQGASEVNN
jgi:hypothetical protein